VKHSNPLNPIILKYKSKITLAIVYLNIVRQKIMLMHKYTIYINIAHVITLPTKAYPYL